MKNTSRERFFFHTMQAYSRAIAKHTNYLKIEDFIAESVNKNSSKDKMKTLRRFSAWDIQTLGHDTRFQITDRKSSYQKSEDYL